jgi:polyisoprenoid-binding protein YceI
MTNYFGLLAAAAVLCAAASVAATPAPAAAPAATTPAGAAQGAGHYTQARGAGSLTFSFMQAGAENHGSFRQFATAMNYDPQNPAAGSLEVTVQTASLDTQDKDRNDMIAGADLLDVKKYPTATYVAKSFAKTAAGGLEAVGKLTLRGVTRDLRVPLTLRATANGYELSGEVTLKRLDFGIGQGELQSTEWVGNEVRLQYKVPLVRSSAATGSK